MARPVKDNGPRPYRGTFIYRNEGAGNRLPWYTVSPRLAADTLAGIKALIRENVQPRPVWGFNTGDE